LKFSYRQILASAGGAVLSAVIASIFGVKGTIVGVAIGSVAATTGTALLFQSIERTNQAVKQVVVRAPESSRLLRRLGGTRATGVTESEPAGASVLTEETATSAAQSEAAVTAVTAAAGEPAADQTEPVPATLGAPVAARSGLRWPVVAGVVAGVFVFSLLLVTGVELIAGRPLADLFGGHSKGTSVGGVFNSPTTSLPPPTTTTTTSSTTTTTTTSPSSTTTTTSVGGSTTTSTGPGTGSTSTTSPASTTTTSPGTSTSSTAVGARATPQVP
jgi:hypothetical protein